MQVGVGLSGEADAYQHQEWIERDGSKCVGGHAVDFAVQVDRNNGHPGGEASHRFPVFCCAETHLNSDVIRLRPRNSPVNASPPWSPPTYAASPDSQNAY